MGLFENFPYSNFHELNLDWILHELKELETEITNFVAINSVKYANPIVWDITSQYETNTVVLDSSGNAYLSVQPVPAGVALDREEYWTKIGNFSALWDSVRSAITPYDEQHSTTASVDHKAGDWVWLENDLLLITKNITAGDKYVDGSNCKKTNVHDLFTTLDNTITNEVNTLSRELQDEITARENGDTTLSQQINKAISDAQQNFIDVKKSGAVGDGITDDSDVFIQAFSGGNKTIFIPNGTYLITKNIPVYSNTHVLCSGTILNHTSDDPDTHTGFISAISANNIVFDNLKIIGTSIGADYSSYKITFYFYKSKNIRLNNCHVENDQSSVSIWFRTCDNVTADGCVIKNWKVGAIEAGDITNNVVVKNCFIGNTTTPALENTYPITISGKSYRPAAQEEVAKNLFCLNNTIVTNNEWEAIDAHGGENILIQGNIIIGSRSGIVCTNSNSQFSPAHNVEIVDNIVNVEVREGFNTSCATIGGTSVLFSGNILLNGGVGVANTYELAFCLGVAVGEDISIVNNTFKNIGGIAIYDFGGNNLSIKNNTADNFVRSAIVNGLGSVFYHATNSIELRSLVMCNNTIRGTSPVEFNVFRLRASYQKYTDKLYVRDNMCEIEYINIGEEYCVSSPSVSRIKHVGTQGDMCLNKNAASGATLGWVCTKSATETEAAVWAALPNIT